jgi:hypothetical protein
MSDIIESFKKMFKRKTEVSKKENEGTLRVNVSEMEKCYKEDDLVKSSIILKHLLEIYGEQKRKNNRFKGREFVHFILSSKHKELKNLGYTHWQNINKIIHLNQTTPYPYHKNNLRKAIDFFEKELKGIKAINMVI